jgi:hypothetical protein
MAQSTALLVAASRSRSDPNSEIQRKLRVAGKAVTDATASLVSAAAAAQQFNKYVCPLLLPPSDIFFRVIRLNNAPEISVFFLLFFSFFF